MSRYDATLNAALSASTSPYVIIDLHNYARWNGGIINQGGPTIAQYASLWSQLAARYKGQSRVIVRLTFASSWFLECLYLTFFLFGIVRIDERAP